MRVPRFLVNIRHQRRQDNYTRTGFVSFFLSLRNTNIAFHARWKCWLISDTIVSKKKKKEINYSVSYSVFLLIEWSERQIWIDYNNGFRVSFFFLFKLRNMSKINVIGEIKIDKNCQNLDRSKRHFSFLWYTESMGKKANKLQTRRDTILKLPIRGPPDIYSTIQSKTAINNRYRWYMQIRLQIEPR